MKHFGGGILLDNIATPPKPSGGTTAIYTKSNGNVYYLQSTGVEQPIGAWVDLGGTNINANATTTATMSWVPGYDIICIYCVVVGYSGADIAGLRFNGISTVANYNQRFGNLATAASATVTTLAYNGVTQGRVLLGPTTTTASRMATVTINNQTHSVVKDMTVVASIASAGATTEMNPLMLASQAEFIAASATTRVQSVAMVTPSQNMLVGSGIKVLGLNLS